MTVVRIFQPSKTAMQSGRGNTQHWLLKFEPEEPKVADPLMGWIGSGDTRTQLTLKFGSRDDAVAYAVRHGLQYELQEARPRSVRPKSYAENFRV